MPPLYPPWNVLLPARGVKDLSFFLSLDTALPPREDYVQVDCVLKPRYKKCTEKEKIKMIGLKRIYKKN